MTEKELDSFITRIVVNGEPDPSMSFKPKKWRCPSGHKWESFGALTVWVGEGTSFMLCPYCMAEQFPAEEVKEVK